MADIIGKRKISKSKSEQTVNLKQLLGEAPTQDQKSRFAREAIEVINQRTLDGKDVDESKFTPYSEAYAERKGVTPDSVDLFLSGDMLESLKLTKDTPHTVSFGIEGGDAAKKSYYHNTGTAKGGKKREFFGITRSEAEKIAESIKKDVVDREDSVGFTLAELRAALSAIGLKE